MLRLIGVRDGDRGAVAMIVAMLFGFGVMLGLAALTIDVGNINSDRRQLQNGADAVALAVAQTCAKTGTCDPTATNLQDLANANAADNATSIRRVDGALPLLAPVTTPAYPAICGKGTGLKECNPDWTQSMSNLQECPAEPPAGVNYVRVYAETKNSASDNILPYYFGAAITGISGANQQACATVTYGAPSGAAAPITLSYCEWAAATGNNPAAPVEGEGTYFLLEPPYGGSVAWPTPAPQLPLVGEPGQEIIISLQGTATTCHTWNGHDVPGGFGYLSTSTGCNTTAAVGGWIQIKTGGTLPTNCDLSPYFDTVLYLPVFDCTAIGTSSAPPPWQPGTGSACTEGNGNTTWYHIVGYAKFYLSGYITSGAGAGPEKNQNRAALLAIPPAPCASLPTTSSDRCLSGWFLKGLVKTPPAPPPPPGTPLLGAYSITLAG